MNFKNALLFMLLISAEPLTHANTQKPVIDQEQINQMMNLMYDLIMPEFKLIYKKYFDEIEWLEHFYVANQKAGDALIIAIAQEFTNILANKIDVLTDVMLKQMQRAQEIPQISAEEKAMFNNAMMQIMPNMMIQGLKKNAELKSSVYQEIAAEESVK